jgi:S-methylmethionine-dependent homocysteine/selenocysteine methylase
MGASIIGGCCEVGPRHIKAIHLELSKRGYLFEAI